MRLFKFKYYSSVAIIYICISAAFFFLSPAPFSYYAFHKNDFFVLSVFALFSFGGLFLANSLLNFGQLSVNRQSPLQIIRMIFFATVFFVVPEEIIFRGFIQGYLQSAVSNSYVAIFLSALVFGLAHLLNGAKSYSPEGWNLKLAAMTFVAGLYLGFAYFITGSLVLPTILHALFIISGRVFVKEV